MGNTDSIPVISQAKSLTQYAFGNATAATETQHHFLYNNTFPVVSQIVAAGYFINGQTDTAIDLQKKFATDMLRIIDSIPVAGHIKGGVHYAMGDNEEGDEAMKAASRSTGAILGGGFLGGVGTLGAFAGGVVGGVTLDGIITGSELLINDKWKPYGYVAATEEIMHAVKKTTISVERGFDIAMMPIGDGITGYYAGRTIRKSLGRVVSKERILPPLRSGYRPWIAEVEAGSIAKVGTATGVSGTVNAPGGNLTVQIDNDFANNAEPDFEKEALENSMP